MSWLFFCMDSYSFCRRLLILSAIFQLINSLLKMILQFLLTHPLFHQLSSQLYFNENNFLSESVNNLILNTLNTKQYQSNFIKMSFLDQIWKQLAAKKKNQNDPKIIEFKSIYEGYRMIPIQSLQRKMINQAFEDLKGENLWKQKKDTKIYTYMDNAPLTNNCSNGFFSSFFRAYLYHGDLKIKPDEIWMIIMLWFTKYVDDNAEELRYAFVKHSGKKELKVETDRDLMNWVPFMQGIIEQIKKKTVQNVVEQLQCNFSTTGLFQKMFSTAIIMNTCKKYFDYTREGAGCGIVNVHMAGTLQDWQHLQKKLLNLQQFDVNGNLKKYVRGLKPVLEQFTETFKGNVHLQFWNNLYFQRKVPDAQAYQPSKYINGWLIKFFTTNNQIENVQQLQSFSVDIKYVDVITKEVVHFNLNGGCKGYSCIDNYVYTPHYSFAIILDQKKMKDQIKLDRIANEATKHKERLMKKHLQTTPIVNKKVITLQFQNQIKMPIEMPLAGFHPPHKKVEIMHKAVTKQKKKLSPIIRPSLMPMSLQKKKTEENSKHNNASKF